MTETKQKVLTVKLTADEISALDLAASNVEDDWVNAHSGEEYDSYAGCSLETSNALQSALRKLRQTRVRSSTKRGV